MQDLLHAILKLAKKKHTWNCFLHPQHCSKTISIWLDNPGSETFLEFEYNSVKILSYHSLNFKTIH